MLRVATTLTGAAAAVAFDAQRLLAAIPGDTAALRLYERARTVLEDEAITPEMYVARLAPGRAERFALLWREGLPAAIDGARALASSFACVLEGERGRTSPAIPGPPATYEQLERFVHGARRLRRPFAVVYLDVDWFDQGREPRPHERLADAHGVVAQRIRNVIRGGDHLGYANANAFLALLALQSHEREAFEAAHRLRRAVGEGISASVGVAVCPDDGESPADLVEKASAAASAAASDGSATPYWFRRDAGAALSADAALRRSLSDPAGIDAIVEPRFRPIVAPDGAVLGVALEPRWRGAAPSPEEPCDYVAADADGLTRERFDRWSLRRAADALAAWPAPARPPLHLRLAGVSPAVADAVRESFGGREGGRIAVELRLSSAPDAAELARFVRALRAAGAEIGVWSDPRDPLAVDALMDLGIGFVVVDAGAGTRTLAGIALGSILAPRVLAARVDDGDRSAWLARQGVAGMRGEAIAPALDAAELPAWRAARPGPSPR